MSNKTLGERAADIRTLLSSKERFADMLSLLGIEVNKSFKFSLREERTPSVAIYNNGTCCDFGGEGKSLDIINIIEAQESCSFFEAIKKAEELLGIDSKGDSTYEFKAPVYVNLSGQKDDYDDEPLKESYIRYFRETLWKNKDAASKHLIKLMPTATDAERKKLIEQFEMGYDPKADKITFPVRSAKGHIMNLAKYSSKPGVDDDGKEIPKLKYLYGRRRVLFNLQVLKDAPKTVLILEGEKDVFNATLNKIPAITQGAASGWKPWMATSIKMSCEFYGVSIPEFIILQDNDRPGVVATLKIFNSLKEIQPKTQMMFWERSVVDNFIGMEKMKPYVKHMSLCKTSHKCGTIPKGFDYTDFKTESA